MINFQWNLFQLIRQLLPFFVACKLLATPGTVLTTFAHNWYRSSGLIFLVWSKGWSLMGRWASCSTSIFTGSQTVSIDWTVKLKRFIIILASTCGDFWCWTWLINWRIFLVRKQFKIFFVEQNIFSFRCYCSHRLNRFINKLIFVSLDKRRYNVANIHRVIFCWMLFTGLFSSLFAIRNVIIRLFIWSVNEWASLTLFILFFGRFHLLFVFRKSLIFRHEIVLNRLWFGWRVNRFWSLEQLSFTTELDFHQVIQSSSMIMTIVNDISPCLNRINVVQLLHIFNDLFIRFDDIFTNYDTFRLISIAC